MCHYVGAMLRSDWYVAVQYVLLYVSVCICQSLHVLAYVCVCVSECV